VRAHLTLNPTHNGQRFSRLFITDILIRHIAGIPTGNDILVQNGAPFPKRCKLLLVIRTARQKGHEVVRLLKRPPLSDQVALQVFFRCAPNLAILYRQ